ncbi:Zinc/iron permease [Endogone sp. FLAS-F59071]|nr:Zinc/iron permease [Endogone sp. FLAS-F59071]|eukprot:RUS17284.1 Zinc/iron permease [Endogone sp. FLAS-F59071]
MYAALCGDIDNPITNQINFTTLCTTTLTNFLGKHFGTGVILATGFIHMLPSAMASLTSPCLSSAWNSDYPVYASLFAMFAALLMQLTEQLASENAEKRRRAATAQEARKSNDNVSRVAVSVSIHSEPLSSSSNHEVEKTPSHPHPHHHTHSEDEADLGSVIVDNNDNTIHSTASTAFSAPVIPGSSTSLPQPLPSQGGSSFNVADVATELIVSHMHSHHTHVHSRANDHYPHHHHHHHDHPLGGHDHDHGILFLESERKKISTYILELGITSHSVIIGIALGVTGGEFTGLLIALVFHQFFEGFALGARISEVYSRSLFAAIMSLIFTLTTPVGIVIGIGISSSYNPNSTAALLTQGIFDSVSAGILLYTAFVNLIAVEFTQNMRLKDLKTSTKVSYYLAMYAGAGIMALIGRWA